MLGFGSESSFFFFSRDDEYIKCTYPAMCYFIFCFAFNAYFFFTVEDCRC